MGANMNLFRPDFLALAILTILPAAPVAAQDTGALGTIERGMYMCELPGTAAGAAGIPQPEEHFAIRSASRYSSPEGRGTYLRRGDILMFTSGPRNGDRYRIMSRGFLRKIENGEPGRLRCVRSGD